MKEYPPRPKWLYDLSYGLAESYKYRVLIDGKRFAVVQSPGGRFMNGQVSQYGSTTYYLVDKTHPDLRGGVGLMEEHVLQDGGRAKLAQWKKLVEASDQADKLVTNLNPVEPNNVDASGTDPERQ